MVPELLWKRQYFGPELYTPQAFATTRAPSWSWVAINEPVKTDCTTGSSIAEVYSFGSENNESLAHENVDPSWLLRITCFIGEIRIESKGAMLPNDYVCIRGLTYGVDPCGHFTPDSKSDKQGARFFAPLLLGTFGGGLWCDGLVLVRSSRHTGAFERIGHLQLEEDVPNPFSPQGFQRRTITLI